jgi:hypothetical protein
MAVRDEVAFRETLGCLSKFGRETMVAKHRERSIFEKAVFCYPESTLSHSYEQLTEMLADVEVDIFRPGSSMPRGRTPWLRCGGRGCWMVHGVPFRRARLRTLRCSRCCLLVHQYSVSVHPTGIYEVVALTGSGATRKNTDRFVGDPDPRDDVFALLGP